MRDIKYIVVHATGGSPQTTIKELMLVFKGLGWKNPGYHYVVAADGTITQLLGEDKVSNGVRGYNRMLINVAYIGGLDAKGKYADTRTPEQKEALRKLLGMLHKKYPAAEIRGHRDFSPDQNHNGIIETWEFIKACPCFDAKKEYKDI
jgi:N-acetylmuramoyl-L-alanine amidase (T3 lysozyme)|nr:MAG TPA: endodeoxyribonuclease I [Caudoviricetes sp.]